MSDVTYHFPDYNTILLLHNNARTEFNSGLCKISYDDKLIDYALSWAEHMSNENKLSHSNISNIMKLGFSRVGENIAYGQKNEKDVMNSWLKSYGHKKNIMNKHYTHMGFGYSYSEKNILYWCVCFGKRTIDKT